jgi:SHS2 domain-containing protein
MTIPTPSPAAPRNWELFPHAADMGVRGYGATPDEAFAHAALALTAIACEPERIGSSQSVDIRCEAADLEVLFVDWLNALIYETAVRGMLFGRYEVHIENGRLTGTAFGEPVDRARHEPAVEVKGATYTALDVHREPGGRWVAQCVVDV